MSKRSKYALGGAAAGLAIGLALFIWKETASLGTFACALGPPLAVWWGKRTGRLTSEDLDEPMITLFPKK